MACDGCTDLYQQNLVPFAVVGSEKSIIVNGQQVRGRQNRWGVINIEDENHCEFVYLRNFLTRFVSSLVSQPKNFSLTQFVKYSTHLQDLIETTAQIHYEAFRSKQLLALKENAKEQQPRATPSTGGA